LRYALATLHSGTFVSRGLEYEELMDFVLSFHTSLSFFIEKTRMQSCV